MAIIAQNHATKRRRAPRPNTSSVGRVALLSQSLTRHLEVRRAIPLRDARRGVVVVRQARCRLVHPPRREVRGWGRGRRRWLRTTCSRISSCGRTSMACSGVEGRLPKLPLVPGQGHLASPFLPGEHEHTICAILGVLGLLVRDKRHKRPRAPRLLPRLQENLNDLSVLGELRLQSRLIDPVRQRSHEALLGALDCRWRSVRRTTVALRGRPDGEQRWVVGLSAKLALMPGNGHLARAVRPGEDQYPVAVLLGVLRLLR
mmetsp:Transcript_64632/g.172416  ORF Transcript_64632/g.172416 Transcript_64632/m.172416 type:complete len:259 (+) Transcript_64632:82-858(+)